GGEEGATRGRGGLRGGRRGREGGPPRPEAPGEAPAGRCRGRRGPRLLGGGARRVAEDTRAARLVPQARQHSRQAPEAAPAPCEGRAPRGDVRRDPRSGSRGGHTVRDRVPRQVPEGGHGLGEGRRRAAPVLRLAGRALDASTYL